MKALLIFLTIIIPVLSGTIKKQKAVIIDKYEIESSFIIIGKKTKRYTALRCLITGENTIFKGYYGNVGDTITVWRNPNDARRLYYAVDGVVQNWLPQPRH